jgi:hypothetical protein
METFKIEGHETIRLTLTRKNQSFGSSLPIDLNFVVVEYPTYNRDEDDWNTQIYTVVAISEYAYLSGLKKISRAVSGKTDDIIVKVLTNDLNFPKSRIITKGVVTSRFNGIITTQSPLSAVRWLAQRTFDANSSPFFVHSTISTGNIMIASYVDLIAEKSYGKYVYEKTAKSGSHDSQDYAERAQKILQLKSILSLNKLQQAQNGGFASLANYTDIATKTHYVRNFSLNETSGSSPFSSGIKFYTNQPTDNPVALNQLAGASIKHVPMNSLSQGLTLDNPIAGGYAQAINRAQAYMTNSETYAHDIVLHGNFELNPGRMIDVEIPKSITEITGNSGSQRDAYLSGKYLIRSTVHSFDHGVYTTALKIIRNSN